ncbi:MAG TPA: M48 family metalloprotease [Allosphingosinicella sp.]|nr:M48 family metalloprotease [Allosphingosinicella sp.]
MKRLPLLLSLALVAVSAPVAAAPVDPTGSALEAGSPSTLRDEDVRVAAIVYRLALGGRAHCPGSYPVTGMLFHHLAEYEIKDRPLMVGRYGLDRGPGVLTVLPNSPASAAGLIAGDVFLSVNGRAFPSPLQIANQAKRKAWRPMLEASERLLEDALRQGPAKLRVLRSGEERDLVLDSVPGCVGRVRLARSTQMNAFSLRGYVIMTTALLGYVRSDDELAVVLGHELAHSILGHEGVRDEEGLLAGLGIKASAMWKREAAADRLGLRLMAAAGYDLDAAIPFWGRYLGQYDWFPQIFRSHPSRSARARIAREEIAAIRGAEAAPVQ